MASKRMVLLLMGIAAFALASAYPNISHEDHKPEGRHHDGDGGHQGEHHGKPQGGGTTGGHHGRSHGGFGGSQGGCSESQGGGSHGGFGGKEGHDNHDGHHNHGGHHSGSEEAHHAGHH